MIVKKRNKTAKAKTRRGGDWRAALRRQIAKVLAVDAIFVNTSNDTIHVYSVVERFEDDSCEQLLKQERKVEKAFPKVSFEFHTRAHQGREPNESGPWGAELIYLR